MFRKNGSEIRYFIYKVLSNFYEHEQGLWQMFAWMKNPFDWVKIFASLQIQYNLWSVWVVMQMSTVLLYALRLKSEIKVHKLTLSDDVKLKSKGFNELLSGRSLSFSGDFDIVVFSSGDLIFLVNGENCIKNLSLLAYTPNYMNVK